jgi:hypothetical protein
MTLTGASSATTTTDNTGNYTFDNLLNGSYNITPSLTGFIFSPTDNTQTVSGADRTGVNFTASSTVVSAVITKFASLDNTQETTGSTSDGVGGGILTVDTGTGKVRGFVVSTGVDNVITGAHVHTAARGIEGPITVPLVGGPDLWFVPDNAANLSPAQVAAFQAGNMYFNIHNDVFSDGAIRGQLDLTPTALKLASLDNTQETTGSTSAGLGGGILGIDNATGQVRGFVVSTGVDNVTAAHVHTEVRGTAGPVTVPLFGGPDLWFVADNATALTPAQVADFQAGKMYFNIHNDVFSDGAIRGQIDFP